MGASHATLETELGPLYLVATDIGLAYVGFEPEPSSGEAATQSSRSHLDRATAQMAEYLAGVRRGFDLDLDAEGTPFERSVWRALGEIPFGETRTYGDVAAGIHRPRAARPVGQAVGANPLTIVVPCHRVVAAGSIGGYMWGVSRKEWLLRLEQR